MNTIWDCVIIGAGPSGSAAAISCARAGFKVLLLDKSNFPRDKVCGCCLNKKSLLALNTLDVLKDITVRTTARLENLNLTIGGRCFDIPLTGNGIAVSRYFLDQALISKAKEVGVSCLFSVKARIGPHSNHLRSIEVDNLRTTSFNLIQARTVIIATGLASAKLFVDPNEQEKFQPTIFKQSYIGIGTRLANNSVSIREGEIKMYVKESGYVGITKLEDGSIDLAGAIAPESLKNGQSIQDAVLKIVPMNIINDFENFKNANWSGTPTLTRKRNFEVPGIYLIGDAARYIEPFTGEGIGWALESGIHISSYLKNKADSYSDNRLSWNTTINQLVGREMSNCNLISRALRHPSATSFLLKSVFAIPSTKKYFPKLLNHGSESSRL